jgi:hypothetical protein
MNRTIYGLDDDGNTVSMTVSQGCVIFIHGVEPEQEHTIQISTTENVSERTEFIGAGVKK